MCGVSRETANATVLTPSFPSSENCDWERENCDWDWERERERERERKI
jgi:hypothetical protein